MDKLNTSGGCSCPKEEYIDHISCEVGSCMYNKDKKHCTATQIKVGPQFASSTSETNCATFKAQ